MEKSAFANKRRQIYLDEESYRNTVAQLEAENAAESPADLPIIDKCRDLQLTAIDRWTIFQLCYTAGESLSTLSNTFDTIVSAYEKWILALDELPEDDYHPPFIMNDMVDTYVDYLNMVAMAILLRREDLVPRICAFNEGTDFDRIDAVLEEIFKIFLPDRPWLDYLLWKKQYENLLAVIDSDTPAEMAAEMKLYVKKWYANMKGHAHFWGKHEKIKPEFTPYFGYWAMCAGVFTYLYEIDDSSYRNETVYPKHLVDYARSIPRNEAIQHGMAKPLRVEGGEVCPRSGLWFSPAKADSQSHFSAGATMPAFPDAQYGLTIWQWMGD